MRIEALALMPVVSNETGKIAAQSEGNRNFSEFLTQALGEVNKLENNSVQANYDLAAGKLEDVSQVTIAAEKATIAVQLTMQVRNKMIDAYQEIMRMQV